MRMRPLTLTILLFLSLATSAWARLGENESAVITRYGRPGYKIHRPWGDDEGFSMNGFSVTVTFINGVSVGEKFYCPGHTITDEQASDLLDANSQGFTWYQHPEEIPKNTFPPIRQIWKRPNGSTATLTNSTFEVKSIWLIIAQQDAANQKPAGPSTQGF